MSVKRIDITRQVLLKLYLEEGLSIYQIANILGCHPATINKKLHGYQIPIKNPINKLNLTRDILERMYIMEKMSKRKIARAIGCSERSITNGMKKFDVKARSIRKTHINKKTLIELYQHKRLSLKGIGNLYGMSPSGILKRMRLFDLPLRDSWETNIIHTKKSFSGSLIEKSYLIGFRIGDLGVRLSSERTKNIRVNSNTTKDDQANLIRGLFSNYSDVWISVPNSRGVISTSTILHPSFSFLLSKKDLVEEWILANKRYMSAFIAGYVDAEGSFGIYNKRARFRLGSYDKNILQEISQWLKKYKIKTNYVLERKKKKGQNQDFWRVIVNDGKSLSILFNLIYDNMKHKKRKADFENVKENLILRSLNGTISI